MKNNIDKTIIEAHNHLKKTPEINKNMLNNFSNEEKLELLDKYEIILGLLVDVSMTYVNKLKNKKKDDIRVIEISLDELLKNL